jgi:hypothetical protein
MLAGPGDTTITSTCAVQFDWNAANDPGGSGVASYNFKLNDTVYTTTALYTQTDCLVHGAYTWTVQAYDHLGNVSGYTDTWSLAVDRLGPYAPVLVSPDHNTVTTDTTPMLTWNATTDQGASDVAGYNVWLGGNIYTPTPPTATTFTPGALENDTYTWTVRAYDSVGNYGDYATPAYTLRVGYNYVYLPSVLRNYTPPLSNGDFEAGFAYWQIEKVPLPVGIISFDGDNTLLLGKTDYPCGNVPLGHAAAEQFFRVPQDATDMTFKYIIWTQDASPSSTYDRFEVYINGTLAFSDGNQVQTGLACDKWRRVPGPENPRNGATSGWATATIDLSSYRGQSITLSFRNYSRFDNWYNTYTYIDDITVETN